MPDRDQLLRTIDDAYAARMRGDGEALGALFAPSATFRFGGDPTLVQSEAPLAPGEVGPAVARLIELFRFHELERVDAVVEGNSVAVHSRFRVSTGGGEPVESELYDLWKFDEAGRVTSLLQFADTALMRHMLQGAKQPA